MRPFITLLTSTELQDALGNTLDDEAMTTLQEFRDTVQTEVRQYLDTVSVMEDLYGETWKTRDIRIWIVDNEDQESTSSPIMINEDSEDAALFTAFQMLAKNLIRQSPPDSDVVDEHMDAAAALLARESMREVVTGDRFDAILDAATAETLSEETWEQVDAFNEDWDTDKTLHDWLDEQH